MSQQFSLSMKAARVENGYTQEALAERLGVTKRTYVAWENGETVVKPYVIFSLAYLYDMKDDQIRVPLKN